MVKLVIESDFWSSSEPLKLSVKRAETYCNSVDFSTIISKMVKEALKINSEEKVNINEYDSTICQFVSKCTAESELTVVVGTNTISDLAQCAPGSKTVYVNSAWLSFIQRIFEMGHAESKKYRVHLALLIVKLLHEVFHSFTPNILECEYKIRRNEHAKDPTIPTYATEQTPLRMGYKTVAKGQTKRGDMGFYGEELLSGEASVRFYHAKIKSGIPWDFDSLCLISFDAESNKFEVQKAANMDKMLDLITSSVEQSLDDFKVTLLEGVEKLIKIRPSKEMHSDRILRCNKKVRSASNYMDIESEADDEEDREFSDVRSDAPENFCSEYGVVESGEIPHLGRKA